jgi:hypothetical protein
MSNKYNFFNKKRVSVSDMNDANTFVDINNINRFGSMWSKGLIKENNIALSGSQTLILGTIDQGGGSSIKRTPANWAFSFGSTSAKFNIAVPAATATQYFGLLALNSTGNLFGIVVNENYRTTPTQFQSRGNLDIPLDASPIVGHAYHIWVCERDVRDSSYNRVDKNGNVNYPKQINGYDIVIVDNSFTAPVGDYIKIGRILYNGVGINPTFFYDEPRIYSGVFQQNVKIKIDNTNVPTTYANNEIKSLADHINAIGNNTITPINPHGTLAEDINALNGLNLTTEGMFKNGILLPDTYDELSNTALFQVTCHNTLSGSYIKLLSNVSNPKFIVRGKLYEISDIVGFNTVIANAVVTNVTASYNQGWYPIYIDVTTDGNYTLNIGDGTFTPITSNLFYQADNDVNKIYLGYVYVYNDAIDLELRRFEKDTATAANNQNILSFYTWGSVNPKDICKSINQEYINHSQNMVMYNMRNDELGNPNGMNLQTTAGTGTIAMTKATPDVPANLNITVVTIPYTARMTIATLPQSARGLDQRDNVRPRIYSVLFNYSNANDYDDVKISLDNGSTFYHIPLLTSGPHQFKLTTSAYPASIIFDFVQNTTSGTYNNFTLSNLELVEGIKLSDIPVDSVIYTPQIAINTSISQAGTNVGTYTTPEKRVTRINLDNLLLQVPISTNLKQSPSTYGPAQSPSNLTAMFNALNFMTTVTTSLKNLEIWIIQCAIGWNGYAYQTNIDTSTWGIGTTYKYIYLNFHALSAGGDSLLAGIQLPTINTYLSTPTNIALTAATRRDYTDTYIPVNGIIIVQKII